MKCPKYCSLTLKALLLITILPMNTHARAINEWICSAGFEVRPVKNATLIGTDFSVGAGIFRNTYLGVDINGAHALTKENYGFNTPGINNYHLAAGGTGIQLTYKLFGTDKASLLLFIREKTDFFLLGDTPLISIPDGSTRLKLYHILSMNAYTSFAPGIGFHARNFYLDASYNFFPVGNTNFGEIADFQGAEFSFDYVFMHKGQPTSLYQYTHRRYHRRYY